MKFERRASRLKSPGFVRIIRLSPFIFFCCLSAAFGGVFWSVVRWPDTVFFLLGSALNVVLARVCLVYLGGWWWMPVALAAPWLILRPLRESVRVGAIPIPALFLLIIGVPGALFFGSLLKMWWRNHRRMA